MSKMNYENIVSFLKQEIHVNGWNALDVSVKDLISYDEENADIHEIVEGLKKNMLEGDQVVEGDIDTPDETIVVRYYCDNLDASRRRLY